MKYEDVLTYLCDPNTCSVHVVLMSVFCKHLFVDGGMCVLSVTAAYCDVEQCLSVQVLAGMVDR